MDTRQIRDEIAMARGTLQRLEASLAVTEKPKLRHGDYGTYNTEGATGNPAVYIDDAGQGCLHDTAVYGKMNDTGCSYATEPSDNGEFVVLGNIFADLTALSEDVVEFETVSPAGMKTAYKIEGDGDLLIEVEGSQMPTVVHRDDVAELVRKLRQMAATAARKSGKQE